MLNKDYLKSFFVGCLIALHSHYRNNGPKVAIEAQLMTYAFFSLYAMVRLGTNMEERVLHGMMTGTGILVMYSALQIVNSNSYDSTLSQPSPAARFS